MFMLNGNHLFTLLGSLSLVLVAEAFWGHNVQEEPTQPEPEDPHQNPSHQYQPKPVHQQIPVLEPIVEQVLPVKIETVVEMEDDEQIAYSIEEAPLDIRMIKYMSTTETVTFTVTSFYRSTVITTPIIYKTDTMLVTADAFVTGIKTTGVHATFTETEVLVDTIVKTQTIHKSVSTAVTMTLTVEEQTTTTEYQPYTLTTTNREVVTDWITVTVDLLSENSVVIPVVELETTSITIPYTKTITGWVTLTETTTECEW